MLYTIDIEKITNSQGTVEVVAESEKKARELALEALERGELDKYFTFSTYEHYTN